MQATGRPGGITAYDTGGNDLDGQQAGASRAMLQECAPSTPSWRSSPLALVHMRWAKRTALAGMIRRAQLWKRACLYREVDNRWALALHSTFSPSGTDQRQHREAWQFSQKRRAFRRSGARRCWLGFQRPGLAAAALGDLDQARRNLKKHCACAPVSTRLGAIHVSSLAVLAAQEGDAERAVDFGARVTCIRDHHSRFYETSIASASLM